MNKKIFNWGLPFETVYNREGYDSEGYDLFGYDREGYDRKGYNWKELLTDNIDYKSKK